MLIQKPITPVVKAVADSIRKPSGGLGSGLNHYPKSFVDEGAYDLNDGTWIIVSKGFDSNSQRYIQVRDGYYQDNYKHYS